MSSHVNVSSKLQSSQVADGQVWTVNGVWMDPDKNESVFTSPAFDMDSILFMKIKEKVKQYIQNLGKMQADPCDPEFRYKQVLGL